MHDCHAARACLSDSGGLSWTWLNGDEAWPPVVWMTHTESLVLRYGGFFKLEIPSLRVLTRGILLKVSILVVLRPLP